MKVKDLIREEIDIDVIDSYDERCWVAFCGPLQLTPVGEARFAEVLEMVVQHHGNIISILTGSAKEAEECRTFFHSAAGFCSSKQWDEWFVED